MSKTIEVKRLASALESVPGIRFALLFGSACGGSLPGDDSDVDVGVYIDHEPDFDERAGLLGIVQDAVGTDRVDLVFLNLTGNVTLQRETLKGKLLVCRDRDAYAGFFSLADRRGRDEEERIRRAWALKKSLAGKEQSCEY